MGRARDHHVIPQDYLRQWSPDSYRVHARRLLVPVETYPEWEFKSIENLTVIPDFYTSISSGAESDAFEQWLNTAFENPAAPALTRVFEDQPLRRDDWEALIFYLAALDRRTPVAYLETMELLDRITPSSLAHAHHTVQRVHRQAKHVRRRLLRHGRVDGSSATRAPVPSQTQVERSPETGDPVLKTTVSIGREAFLGATEHLLTITARRLLAHDWTILKPVVGSRWFTSDHPVVRLNYQSADHYDFKGGWGNPGAEIFLALSPQHLLYCRIGHAAPREKQVSQELTIAFQRCIAERASRWIFSSIPQRRAEILRPRDVDKGRFAEEEAAWTSFHERQLQGERESA